MFEPQGLRTPSISVVMATFNRSNVLRWSIESVLQQTFQNWELWVIGDACTDDTGEVVLSYADPRIQFINLPKNNGGQSGPNNEGCIRSKGEYIAFLNHDDLWFPDHLEKAWNVLRSTNADLVFSLVDRITAEGKRQVNGMFRDNVYEPGLLTPASSWVFRRALFDEVGPWRHYRDIHNIPSQDWLFRVWRKGKRIQVVPYVTVIAVSGKRMGGYANREEEEQKLLIHQMKEDPFLRERELNSLLFSLHDSLRKSMWYLADIPLSQIVRLFLFKMERFAMLALKIDLVSIRRRLKLERRGKFVDRLRAIKGLEEKPRIRKDRGQPV